MQTPDACKQINESFF